jgi:diguanylate cyclase (GGDEF)-like protein/PAS domain S-box-containing protein
MMWWFSYLGALDWRTAEITIIAAVVLTAFGSALVFVAGHIRQKLFTQTLRFDTALNNMSQGLCMFDAAARLIVCNERYLKMYRLSRDAAMAGISLHELLERRKEAGTYSGDARKYVAKILAAIAEGRTTRLMAETGDGRSIAIVNQPMDGGGWVATHEDMTERVQAERERDRTRTFLNTVIENIPVTVFVKDARERRYVLINRSAERLWGVPRRDAVGKTAHDLFGKAHADVIEAQDTQLLGSNERELFLHAHPMEMPNGDTRLITTRRVAISGEDGQPQYLVGVIEDVTERARAEQQIAHLARHDALTNLLNRVSLRERLQAAFSAVRRGQRVALLYIDLDHFKRVNDTLGHSIGDQLLTQVAERLCGCVREIDTIARLGGDEFAILQAAISGPADAAQLAERIRDALTSPCDVSGHHLSVDASIGVALAPDDAGEPDQLLNNADMALYEAKATGRGTCSFYARALDERMKARRRLQLDLRGALARGEFEVFYQPLLNLHSNEISGVEALLRWHHPERGMILPGEFIPIAEDISLIHQLGEWVLRSACTEVATWPAPIKVAVNLSAAQLASGNLFQAVVGGLAAAGLSANRLELEVNESALMENAPGTLATLHQLHKLGVRIAMDDFGTGTSSLSHLRSFPFDKVKIDANFICDVGEENNARAFVQAVVNLARSLEMTTTVEGVETWQQMQTAKDLGCCEIQGHVFSHPRPAAEISRLLLRRAERTTTAA